MLPMGDNQRWQISYIITLVLGVNSFVKPLWVYVSVLICYSILYHKSGKFDGKTKELLGLKLLMLIRKKFRFTCNSRTYFDPQAPTHFIGVC